MLLPMTVAGLIVTGMGLALLGSVKVALAERLQIDEARVGGLVAVFGFTMIPVILTAGILTDTLGRQTTFMAGVALMALGLVSLAYTRTYLAALLSVLILSAAWSAQINVLNVLMPLAFLSPDEIPERMSYATNLGNVFFGLGALLTPLGISALMRRVGFTPALLFVAGLVLVPAVLSLGVEFELQLDIDDTAKLAPDSSFRATLSLLANPVMWLCALSLFFYGPLEAAVAAWSTTYANEKGFSAEGASFLLSGFWTGFVTSRVIAAFWLSSAASDLATRLNLTAPGEALLILVLALACVLVTAGFVWSRGRSACIAVVVGAGFAFGPIFPSILAILLGHVDESLHGRAVGVLFAIGGLGWTTIPILIGTYAQRRSVQRGFLIAVGSALGLCLVAGVMVAGGLN